MYNNHPIILKATVGLHKSNASWNPQNIRKRKKTFSHITLEMNESFGASAQHLKPFIWSFRHAVTYAWYDRKQWSNILISHDLMPVKVLTKFTENWSFGGNHKPVLSHVFNMIDRNVLIGFQWYNCFQLTSIWSFQACSPTLYSWAGFCFGWCKEKASAETSVSVSLKLLRQ